ncbi:MAG TPA: hypothetical protein DDX98_08865 [Bacteroidales bacterium]|mgnify:CR=1 FL=1|jgi:hypothetical protein|nr:hypothetical protein [Bacteroidales bacterium]
MIKNFTYRDPEIIAEVDALIGKEYSLLERIRKGGTGSPRFMIVNASDAINKHLIKANNINYSSIERRPTGIIVNFYSVLNHYIWVIPYDQLELERHGDSYKIESNDAHLRFSPKLTSREHQRFMTKILADRDKYLRKYNKKAG